MPQNCTSEELAKLTPTMPESSKTQQQENKLAAQVLFQARRVDKPSGQSHCIFVCALSQMKELSFGNVDDLLSHAREYHVSIAMAYPDGSAWKFYLFNCAERAKERNHARNNPFLQLNTDHMRFLGPGTAHGIRPQPYNLPPSKTAKNLDKAISGPTVPLKRSAETGPSGRLPRSQADFNEELGSRKRHVGSAHSKVPGNRAIPPSHGSSPKDGTRKGRSGNSRPILRPAGRKRKVDLLLEPCLECHRRGSRCTRLLGDTLCEPCRSNGLECKVLDHDSNVAQAPKSTLGDEKMNSPEGSVTDDALCSSSETVEDEASANYNDSTSIEVLLQPQTKAITLEQLEIEVENIHKAVDNLEASCRQGHQDMVAQVQLPLAQRLQINYSAFIGRHKSFLQEIHDLCLATQHPVASEKLRSLPKRINVPARLWQTGVASPLEILRMLLPESREHAITFIQTCFNMTALFFETVPEFDSTWLECLGDLSRYRLGLADKDEDTETFSSIATYWFRRALDIIPQTGRLRHHLAVLVPNLSVEQLSLYGHALTAYVPFYAARKSFLASLRPVLEDTRQLSEKVPRLILTLLRAHAALFAGGPGSLTTFNNSTNQIIAGMFDSFIQTASKEKSGLKKFGVHVAIANSAAIMEYGATMEDQSIDRSLIRYAFLTRHVTQVHSTSRSGPTLASHSAAMVPGGNTILSRITIYHSCRLTFGMLSVALRRPRDENLHPMVHVSSVMLWAFCNVHAVIKELETMIPWKEFVAFLNIWSNALTMKPYLTSPNFPHAEPAGGEALPEDFMMQGLWFSQDYLPNSWCENADLDLQERLVEKEIYVAPRVERILWLAYGIASHEKWMHFDRETKSFRCNDAYIAQLKHPLKLTELNCELEPLYPPEAQSPPNAVSWNSHAPLRQGIVPGRGPHSRPWLLMLSHRWSDFRQQCENFLSSPPKEQETLLQNQRQLGETIAQDFLAVVESLRDERDTQRARGHEWHQFEHNRQNLKLDMQSVFRKIHQVAQDARILENTQMSTDHG